MMKTSAKRILDNLHLLEPSRRLLWPIVHLVHRFGRVDRKIYTRYLLHSKVRKLHIGCGEHLLPGWLNTDYFSRSPDVAHLDARRSFPFSEGTFDYIFSEHMIQVISYRDGLKMLAECHRVLKTSGKIRISTPDLAFLINLYHTNKSPLQIEYIKWASSNFIKGVPVDNEIFVINNFMRDWGHTFIYDENTLRGAMMQVGFTKITKCNLQESEDDALRNLENEMRMPPGFLRLESFTLEGTKSAESLCTAE